MNISGDPNFLMWLGTSLIALLGAGGGVVAYLRYFRPPRPKLKTRIWMLDNPYYQLVADQTKLIINRRTKDLPGPAHAEAESFYPALNLDVTNPTDKRISVNAVQIHFTQIRALRPSASTPVEIVIQYRAGTPAERRETLAQKYGLQLTESDDDLCTYQLSAGQAAEVVAQIAAETDVVERAFTNEPGKPHKEFAVTKPVDIKLMPERKDYTYIIAETIAPHDSVKVPILIGASESLTGSASISLIFEADQSHAAGECEITIEVPDYVRTTGGDSSNT